MFQGYRIRSMFLPAALLLLSVNLQSQYYNTGQDPASFKWLQVKTGRFNVIYPRSYGQAGVEFASALEKACSDLSVFFPEKRFRIPVIIHNHTTQSNGYVAWAPKRIEIYPTPDQNTIPVDYKRQLALHELTHVFQMESLNTGFSKAMSFVAGQQFPGAMAALLPMWYIEGEAVLAETYLSGSGRGRSPGFQNSLKAIAIEKEGLYKYDKLFNGSYRDYTPDYYQYGYQMYAWSLLNSEPGTWNKALRFTANQPFTINPVNISLRRNAGFTKKQLYYQTFDTLASLWKKDIEISGATDYDALNPPKKTGFEGYHSAIPAGRDSIIAVKTSLYRPVSFVLINPSDRSENKIFVPGGFYPWFISYARGKIVWVETRPDPRWDNRNYSVIRMFDLKSSTPRQLTFMSRYLSAAISPDGKTIAASENTTDNLNNLVFIDPEDGSVIKSVPAPDNAYLQRPQWSSDGQKLTVISLADKGEGILAYHIAENRWETLLEEGRDDLQASFLRNDSLFYVSSVTGTDNVFILTPEKSIIPLTRSKFGATDINVSGGKVYFSNYSSSGNNICAVPISEASEIEKERIAKSSYLIDRFEIKEPKEHKTDHQYNPEPYRKWKHLFGIHSWLPLYADIEKVQSDPASIRPGFTIMSQNQLSTMTALAGYEYSADRRHELHSRIIWEGWYPVIESRLDYGNEPVIDLFGETPGWTPSPIRPGFRFHNSIYIPWYFSTGKYSKYLYPFLTIDYRNNYLYIKETGNYDYGQTRLTGRLFFANYHKSAYRDIYPRTGQVIDASYETAPFDDRIYGSNVTLKSIFYFPGFFRNHGIRIRYETENQVFVKYLTSNKVNYPRGYTDIISKELDFLSFDYVAPLVYPDFNIASLLYVKRIRTGLFYDYARGTDNYFLVMKEGRRVVDRFIPGKEEFSSFGAELISDFYLFRIPYTISAGAQAVWKSLHEPPSFRFLFNIDIYGMNIGKIRR